MLDKKRRFLLILIISLCLFLDTRRENFSQKIPYEIFDEIIKNNMRTKMNDPSWVKYIDKLEFKKYAAERGVKTFPNLATYSQEDSQNFSFDNLPNDYIIKSNKGSGRNIIIRNGNVDANEALSKIKNWGKVYRKSEPQYEYIIPKIFVESLVIPIPDDIKIFYYNGEPVAIQIDVDRYTSHKRNYYDIEGNLLKMKDILHGNIDKNTNHILDVVKRDGKLKKLIELSRKLAKGVDLNLFRVDFYYIDGEFYGGEITLTPGGGAEKIVLT
tara:strand:- start:104 stop:913 length:810 start_codon:yes stop_codon:yes gene_type:complete